MESDITGTILSVLGRGVNGGKTIYDIAFSDGNTYTTFDGALAGKAQALQGQQVSARVKVAPNPKKPQYTNFYLNDVAPLGQLPPQAQPAVAGTQVAVAGAIPVTPAPAAQIPIVPQESQELRNARIQIQAATKCASAIVASLFQGAGPDAAEEAADLTMAMAKDFFGFWTGGQAQAATPVAETPQEVAAEVNAEVAGAVAVGTGQQEAALPWLS